MILFALDLSLHCRIVVTELHNQVLLFVDITDEGGRVCGTQSSVPRQTQCGRVVTWSNSQNVGGFDLDVLVNCLEPVSVSS